MQPDYGAPAGQPVQPNYDFITNPQQPQRKRSFNFGGNSLIGRVIVVGIGLVVLIVAFSIIRGVLSGGGNKDAMLHVVQDQQEIVHLVTTASQQPGISSTNKNFAVSTKLVVGSQQSQLVSYLRTEKQKIPTKQLNLKVSGTLDTQLSNAAAGSTYDATFHDIMQTQLTNYQSALKLAYNQTHGPSGRKLLSEDYHSATLLLQQLTATN